jgi:hypothetical protein
MRFLAVIVLGLMAATPAFAQYSGLRPEGAVPVLNGCNGMAGYPDCHPDRVYEGRSVVAPARPGAKGAVRAHRPAAPSYPGYGHR